MPNDVFPPPESILLIVLVTVDVPVLELFGVAGLLVSVLVVGVITSNLYCAKEKLSDNANTATTDNFFIDVLFFF